MGRLQNIRIEAVFADGIDLPGIFGLFGTALSLGLAVAAGVIAFTIFYIPSRLYSPDQKKTFETYPYPASRTGFLGSRF